MRLIIEPKPTEPQAHVMKERPCHNCGNLTTNGWYCSEACNLADYEKIQNSQAKPPEVLR